MQPPHSIITGRFVLGIFGGRLRDYRFEAWPAGSDRVKSKLNFRNWHNLTPQVNDPTSVRLHCSVFNNKKQLLNQSTCKVT